MIQLLRGLILAHPIFQIWTMSSPVRFHWVEDSGFYTRFYYRIPYVTGQEKTWFSWTGHHVLSCPRRIYVLSRPIANGRSWLVPFWFLGQDISHSLLNTSNSRHIRVNLLENIFLIDRHSNSDFLSSSGCYLTSYPYLNQPLRSLRADTVRENGGVFISWLQPKIFGKSKDKGKMSCASQRFNKTNQSTAFRTTKRLFIWIISTGRSAHAGFNKPIKTTLFPFWGASIGFYLWFWF